MDQATIVFISGIAILGLLFWYLASDVEKRKRNIGTILIFSVLGICAWALVPQKDPKSQTGAKKPPLNLGIDLAGGSAMTVRLKAKKDEVTGDQIPVDKFAVDQAIKTLRERLDPNGQRDIPLTPQGDDRIVIQIPGDRSDEEVAIDKEKILKTAKLELRAVYPQSSASLAERVLAGDTVVPGHQLFWHEYTTEKGEDRRDPLFLSKRIEVKGKDVKEAWPDPGRAGVIVVKLSSAGGKRMIRLTKNMNKGSDRLAIVLDGVVKSAPVVNDILSSNFIIQGIDGAAKEREDLCAALLNPLENAVEIEEERTVSATLGDAVIKQGVYAGIAGLLLTLIFVIIYYRFAGIIALLGLSVTTGIVFGTMAMFDFTFTLPGIAGIILTIGIAVDANVLIYERLREELKEGKSVKSAIQNAYDKAFSAIFDANITTLITAIILFWIASGTVKGFAITLTIGILASMFAALVATRVLFWWGTGTGILKKLGFFNIIPDKQFKFMSKRKIALMISATIVLCSLGMVAVKRDKSLGIDFVGGSIITFQLGDEAITQGDAQSALGDLTTSKLPNIQVENVPSSGTMLTVRCATEDASSIISELRKDIPLLGTKIPNPKLNDPAAAPGPDDPPLSAEVFKTTSSIDSVGATLGDEFLKNSIIALGLGLLGVLSYITLRFEFSFAIGAFAALFHDVLIAIGIVVLLGNELSLIHVGAFLTIAGYSINDTIVVFDRIREALRFKRGDVEHVMDIAINATLSRTVLTSLTTFVAVLVLYIFGGPALKAFSLAIMIGVVVGTYSSIFVASPIVLIWSKMRGTNLRRELLDANLEAQVNPARS